MRGASILFTSSGCNKRHVEECSDDWIIVDDDDSKEDKLAVVGCGKLP